MLDCSIFVLWGESVRQRLRKVWTVAYPVLAVSGWVLMLTSFLLRDLEEVRVRIEPYQDSIIGAIAFLLLLAVYGWLTWVIGREVRKGILGYLQKRRESRKLKDLTKAIALAKQFTYSRIARNESSETVAILFDAIVVNQADLRKKLTELAVPHPAIPTKTSAFEVFQWAMYLDVLLPLAIRGDIEEARTVLGGVVGQEGSDG